MSEPGKRKGCLFYVLLIAGVMTVTLAVGVFFGIRYGKSLVENYTEERAVSLPRVTLSEGEITALRGRIERFGDALERGEGTEPLVLTSDELNALIATQREGIEFRNRLYVMLEGDRFNAKLSIPAEDIGLESLRGRYINAEGSLDVALKDGAVWVTPGVFSVRGRRVPETLMRQLRGQNLAARIQSDPQAKEMVGRLEEIRVTDGTLVLVPERPGR